MIPMINDGPKGHDIVGDPYFLQFHICLILAMGLATIKLVAMPQQQESAWPCA